MSTIFQDTETLILKEKKAIDRSVTSLMAEMAHENTLLPDTPLRLLQRALKVYRGVRPLFTVIAKLPLLPPTWGAVLEMFIRALDAVAAVDVTTAFKAGKDL